RPAFQARTSLEVDALHRVGGIARPGARADRRRLGDALQVGGGELHLERGEVLVYALRALRAGDRDDVLALREQPREHELRRRALLLVRDLLQAAPHRDVRVEVLGLEARVREAAVALGQVALAVPRAGEHAAAERRVGDERDAELAAAGERLFTFFPV